MKTDKTLYADIHLSINADDSSGLMEIIRLPINRQRLLIKEAVMFAIENDKPNLLRTIFATYSAFANFTFQKIMEESSHHNHTNNICIRTPENRWDYPHNFRKNNSCPLVYAVSLKKWDCAIVIAEIISQHKLGNAQDISCRLEKNDYTPNEFAFYTAMDVQNKQYDLGYLLLEAGVKINTNNSFMIYATHHKDSQLIQMGFIHNAPYSPDLAKNELFASEWKSYQAEKRKLQQEQRKLEEEQRRFNAEQQQRLEEEARPIRDANNRIKDINFFLSYANRISITGKFIDAMNMDDMFANLSSILDQKLSPVQTVKLLDQAISDFLENSANQNTLKDFNWQADVLGVGQAWVGGLSKVQFKVLNEEHKQYIKTVNSPDWKPNKKEKKELAPQQFFAQQVESPKAKNNTNDAVLDDNIPKSFCCPISMQKMTKPMMFIPSGRTFQEELIRKHLETKRFCPLTFIPMGEGTTVDEVLKLNYDLLAAIEEYDSEKKSVIEMK